VDNIFVEPLPVWKNMLHKLFFINHASMREPRDFADIVVERPLSLEVYAKARNFFEDPDNIINPLDFKGYGGFDQRGIENDIQKIIAKLARIAQRETVNEKEIARCASVFEALFADLAELNNWVGESTMVGTASKYDDLFNGVDVVMEMVDTRINMSVPLAIDVTSSEQSIVEKLGRIKDSIDSSELTRIDYFRPVAEGTNLQQGRLSCVAKCVVAVDRETIAELGDLWIKKDKASYAKLANHPIQHQILEQLSLQLGAFLKYARSRSGSQKTSMALANALERVQTVKKSKSGGAITDPMTQTMRRDLVGLFEPQVYKQAA